MASLNWAHVTTVRINNVHLKFQWKLQNCLL